MAKVEFFWAHHQASEVTVLGGKKIGDFDLFCLRSGTKCEPTLKSAPKYADFATFFDTFDFQPPKLMDEM